MTSGNVDAIKVAKLLFKKKFISGDCLLVIDEMYLQKSVQYHSGNFVGQDEEGNLYMGIVNFMIVSLKQSIPAAIKSCPEKTISGKWLKYKIDKSTFELKS